MSPRDFAEIYRRDTSPGDVGESSSAILGIHLGYFGHASRLFRALISAIYIGQTATGISDIDQLVQLFIENEDQNFKMFNYLNELNVEIEKGEEASRPYVINR